MLFCGWHINGENLIYLYTQFNLSDRLFNLEENAILICHTSKMIFVVVLFSLEKVMFVYAPCINFRSHTHVFCIDLVTM